MAKKMKKANAKPPKPRAGKQPAKGPKKAKADPNWWKAQIKAPSKKAWMEYERSQERQFNPLIRELARQGSMVPAMDPRVLEAERQMGLEPTAESISQGFANRLGELRSFITGLQPAKAAGAVGDVVSAFGGALGVESAPELAGAAGTVSGVAPSGRDVMTEAILGGASAKFAGLEQESLQDRAARLQQLGMSKAEALKEARQERRQIQRDLAGLRGQRMAATMNPFERAMQFMQFGQALEGYQGGGGGGYGGGGYGAGGGYGSPEGPVEEQVTAGGAFGSMGSEAVAAKAFTAQNRGKSRNQVPFGVTSTPAYTSIAYPSRGAYPFTGTPGGTPTRGGMKGPGKRPSVPQRPPTPKKPGTPKSGGSPYRSKSGGKAKR